MAVMRHRSASLRCQNLGGEEIMLDQLEFSLSELVQHEMDHLDGILMVDRLTIPTAVIAREMAQSLQPPLPVECDTSLRYHGIGARRTDG